MSWFFGKKGSSQKTPVQRPPGGGPPQIPVQNDLVSEPHQSGGGFFDLPTQGSIKASTTPSGNGSGGLDLEGLNMGGSATTPAASSNSGVGGSMFGGLSVKGTNVMSATPGAATPSSFGFLSSTPGTTTRESDSPKDDKGTSGFGFMGGGTGAGADGGSKPVVGTATTSSTSVSSGFGFMGTPSSSSSLASTANSTANSTTAPAGDLEGAASGGDTDAASASTPVSTAQPQAASTPVIGAMGLAPITAGKSRKKKKKGRKVGFGRSAALQEMQASEAGAQRASPLSSQDKLNGDVSLDPSAKGGSGNASSGGSSMLAGLNIRKKTPKPASTVAELTPPMSEEEKKFQEDMKRAMEESMRDVKAEENDTMSNLSSKSSSVKSALDSASQPMTPAVVAGESPTTESQTLARRPSISGTSLLRAPNDLPYNSTPSEDASAVKDGPVTLSSTLESFSVSSLDLTEQVRAFSSKKASLRERKRSLEEASQRLAKEVTEAEGDVLQAIENEDFEKAESCQVVMGDVKAQQSRNDSELRVVASSVDGLRAEQISLFERHMLAVNSLMERVDGVKTKLETSLKEASTASTDNVERERRRLSIVVQKLDLEKEHLDLDAKGVSEDRLALDAERSQERSEAEKELSELGAARLSVESDLEELRRQVAEKEKELSELNEKAERATALLIQVSAQLTKIQ